MKVSKYDDEGSLLCVSFFIAFLMSPYNSKSESINTIGTCTGNTKFSKLASAGSFRHFRHSLYFQNLYICQHLNCSKSHPTSFSFSFLFFYLCLYLHLFHYSLFFLILSNFKFEILPRKLFKALALTATYVSSKFIQLAGSQAPFLILFHRKLSHQFAQVHLERSQQKMMNIMRSYSYVILKLWSLDWQNQQYLRTN